ncbi:MAG: geopeptide radical SAM maturase [Deltaproteobacteria bacterium]|nr:geopeptide radical SAM maturase [Deltaproteobacteria bacterium]
MELSRYLKYYPSSENHGNYILFSTWRLSKIEIRAETFRAIQNGEISPGNEKLLAGLGMLVSDREEEKRSVLTLFDRANKYSTGMDCIVVLNLDCNFACKYCFEGGLKGNLYMAQETADRLIGFIKERFTDNKKTLLVDFYGGEPLLSIDLIKYISRELKAFTEEKGASYNFSLVTNGALLKRKTALELAELGLINVKITIDGPSEIHNKNRPFKSGAPSFDVLIKNIKETWDIIKINLGGNFEKDNYRDFPLLLDYLEKEGLTPEKLGLIKFDPVAKRSERVISPTDYRGGCITLDEPWLLEANDLLREDILRRGYKTLNMRHKLCMIESQNSYVVNYDGSLYKCPGFIGMEEFKIGNINDRVSDYKDTYNLELWKNDRCIDCEYLPLCYGGCRYMTFLRDNNVKALDCQKEYLDATLETMIKQEIKYGLRVGK